MFDTVFGTGLKTTRPKRRLYLENFKIFMRAIAASSWFNSFIMYIIVINAIVLGLETSESLKETYYDLFLVADNLFLAIYTVEFLVKVYADTKGYWKNGYNIFDFSLILLSYMLIIMSQIFEGDNYFGVFRLIRALRALRTISFVEGLQVLVTALIDTIRNSVLNVVFLLALLMLFFGVIGYHSFGYEEDDDTERWGSLNAAMLSLFAFVTADGWTDIQRRLEQYPGSQWFVLVFIFLGHFIFTNLFIGIIIMNIHEATEKHLKTQQQERDTQLRLKKKYLYKRQHDDVRKMLEKQKTNQYTNFQEMANGFYETLRHDDYVITKDSCTDLVWLETYIDSLNHLDLYMYRIQQGHRNMALVLGEMAERKYKKQHGLLITDELDDGYKSYLKSDTNTEGSKQNLMSKRGSIGNSITTIPSISLTREDSHKTNSSSHLLNTSRMMFEDIMEEDEGDEDFDPTTTIAPLPTTLPTTTPPTTTSSTTTTPPTATPPTATPPTATTTLPTTTSPTTTSPTTTPPTTTTTTPLPPPIIQVKPINVNYDEDTSSSEDKEHQQKSTPSTTLVNRSVACTFI